MPAIASQQVVPLMDVLRARQARAQGDNGPYLAPVVGEESMLFWLTHAAREARLQAGRLQVHVAASAGVNQSTIDRFEKHEAWPRDPDRFVNAYADDLDIRPDQIWAEALRLWQEHLAGDAVTREMSATLTDLVTALGDETADAGKPGERRGAGSRRAARSRETRSA